MLSSSCILSHGETDIADKPLQYNRMTLPPQMGLVWSEGGGKGAPKSARGHSRQFTYIGGNSLCYILYLSPMVLAWTLSSLSESFHVLEVNTISLSSIFFPMQSEFFSLSWINFLFLCGPFESCLAPNPGVGKVMRAQEIRCIRSQTRLTRKHPWRLQRKMGNEAWFPWQPGMKHVSCSLELMLPEAKESSLILSAATLEPQATRAKGFISCLHGIGTIFWGGCCLMASPVLQKLL